MTSADPIREFAHDHADLNRRVRELGAMLTGRAPSRAALLVALCELREHLFTHFAREEEGLFPFVAEHLPELAERVHAMTIAHDAICGTIARLVHLVSAEAQPEVLRSVFERFEAAYAAHASAEAELLRDLAGRLDADRRTELAALVRGL